MLVRMASVMRYGSQAQWKCLRELPELATEWGVEAEHNRVTDRNGMTIPMLSSLYKMPGQLAIAMEVLW